VPIEPDERQISEVAGLAGGETDGPVVMLNLCISGAEPVLVAPEPTTS